MLKIIPKFAAIMTLLLALSFLAACGDGGGNSSTTSVSGLGPTGSGTQTGAPTATLSLGNSALQLSGTTSVTASFTRANGLPASGISVNFSTSLGSLTPATGIAVTDSSGTATVQLAASASGSGQITATASVDNVQLTKTASFTVSLPPLSLSALTIGLSTLSYGGSTSVSVTVLDANGLTYTAQDVDVSFTSTQSASGAATITSTTRTVNGVATVTYKAETATGTDTITASITGSSKTATVTIIPRSANAINFVSAVPSNIGLKGMGGVGIQETSQITFKVLDTAGQPKSGQQVNFSLNTSIGGLTLTAYSASSASDGTVTTYVQAGTIATPVRVTASLPATTIATQSDQLVVSTGVPAQDGFSISIANLNPESFNIDGVTDLVTARLSDHFHNPVPDGTSVYFTTSGGSIQPSCTTISGACSVTWTSQNPRPTNPGRARILAYAVGEESFLDLNGNGLADAGEFTDTSEPFRDDNEDGSRNASETFIDFNGNGSFDSPDGLYNGILRGTAYSTAPMSKYVFSNSTLVMATGSAIINLLSSDPMGAGLISFTVTDGNGNTMPSGTTVAVTANNGTLGTVTSFVVPQNIGYGQIYAVPIASDGTPSSGAVSITVSSPSGIKTIRNIVTTGI